MAPNLTPASMGVFFCARQGAHPLRCAYEAWAAAATLYLSRRPGNRRVLLKARRAASRTRIVSPLSRGFASTSKATQIQSFGPQTFVGKPGGHNERQRTG